MVLCLQNLQNGTYIEGEPVSAVSIIFIIFMVQLDVVYICTSMVLGIAYRLLHFSFNVVDVECLCSD